MICSGNKLDLELDNIRKILIDNGYPEHVINRCIERKLTHFNSKTSTEPTERTTKDVYIHLPWIGPVSTRFEKQLVSAVSKCYDTVKTNVIFTTTQLLPATRKDVLPALEQSNVVYEYKCHCDCGYVGRTTQRLQDRINQHVPRFLRTRVSRPRKKSPLTHPHPLKAEAEQAKAMNSAIGKHLMDNSVCAENYRDDRFRVVGRGRSHFHLCALESTFIKIRQPSLCQQKEFVYHLKIVH